MGGDLEKCFLPDLKTYFDPHFYFTDSGDLRDELLISELDGYSGFLVLFSSLKISYMYISFDFGCRVPSHPYDPIRNLTVNNVF